jgi:hypothetical protein
MVTSITQARRNISKMDIPEPESQKIDMLLSRRKFEPSQNDKMIKAYCVAFRILMGQINSWKRAQTYINHRTLLLLDLRRPGSTT